MQTHLFEDDLAFISARNGSFVWLDWEILKIMEVNSSGYEPI